MAFDVFVLAGSALQLLGLSQCFCEAEGQWATARQAILGQHFGRSVKSPAGDAVTEPFGSFPDREEACRRISEAGVSELSGLLARSAKTSGKPWRLEQFASGLICQPSALSLVSAGKPALHLPSL